MAASNGPVNVSFIDGSHPGGTPLASVGTSPFVLNSDSLTQTGDWVNPYALEDGSGTGHGDVFVVNHGGGLWLELWHEWSGDGTEEETSEVTTAPRVVVYGFTPTYQSDQKRGLFLPEDLEPTFAPLQGRWNRCPDREDSTVTKITIPATVAVSNVDASYSSSSSAGEHNISESRWVWLRGSQKLMVAIETAAIGPSVGMICGRIVS